MNLRTTDALALFSEYREAILRLGFRITRNADDAEEVLQETFLRLQQHLPRLDLTGNMAGWLFRTATHLAIDRCRHRASPLLLEEVHTPSGTSWGDPEQVRKAVDRLPPALRDLVMHRFSGGLKPGDIARLRGVPPGRVRVQIFRALQMLRTMLGDFR